MNNNPMNFLYQVLNQRLNPNAVLEQMIKGNPQMQFVLNQAKSSGMSLKDYTMQYAKQNNIDINSYLQMMSQFGIKL